ncbi:hypothetical protein HNR40_001794 [Nonomuraea endophytica]|uniref:Uncharacterized protein n=1 Tax=Nonomuraea endophytica TaxID=714136 RepID=A0A7W8ED95_9ACTN|nr:hypothetical protein [Nonomuraea endophytica]
MALRSDGTVWTWGFNCCGQIGDGTTSNRIIAFRVPGLTGITKISAGGDMSAAVRNDGTVWTWGRNLGGELGDGTTTNRTSPVQVSGPSGAIEVAAGSGSHTGAITAPDATPDFTIDTPYHPTTIRLIPSFNTSALVTTHARYGSNQLINLTASINPPTPGIAITFNSPAVIAGAASTVTMQVDESVPAGTYTITFTGTAGGTVHSTSFPLTLTRTHNPGGDPAPEPEPEDPPCNPRLGCP